ncbi:MAG: HlyD family secretion protein [Helicobacteraceae bacterium]|nr:HlyD family secretion protein [Helicobacteraceae bacterium]
MKIIISLFFLCTLVFSKVYYSKVEPYELREISSNVSGTVLFIDEDNIGKKLTNHPYLIIDAELDQKELVLIQEKLLYLEEMIKVNEDILENLEESLGKKRENYKRIESLKIKSIVEKDREFHELITSENLFLNTQKEIDNLKVQVTDLKLRRAQLEKSIKDKHLIAKDFVLYSLDVKVGQVVNMATLLAKIADTSSAKLTLFLDEEDVADAKTKAVYIDGLKTEYKISRLLKIADSKNISKYMAQIIIDAPKIFSKLVKVELRDE